MRKLILSAFVAVLGLTAVKAQEGFKVEATIGATIGDASEAFGINYGIGASYLYPVMDNFHVGGKVGLDIFNGKKLDAVIVDGVEVMFISFCLFCAAICHAGIAALLPAPSGVDAGRGVMEALEDEDGVV